MSNQQTQSGFANIGNAKIYFEIAGDGQPFVMIHAGVADSRQWNSEFAHFADRFRAVRYDMRGYGRSEPVDGEFSHMKDLLALLDQLEVREPLVLMGCSMGGGLAMDFALTHPSRARALIMVDSGPSGLKLDVPKLAKFDEVEKAFDAGQLDRVAELETQIWFDGTGRTNDQVDQKMRKLVVEMDRLVLAHETKNLGKRMPDSDSPAAGRLGELEIPVLIVVGVHDTPYSLAAADHMAAGIRLARKVTIEDAAHLPNLDHPDEFRRVVEDFLGDLPA